MSTTTSSINTTSSSTTTSNINTVISQNELIDNFNNINLNSSSSTIQINDSNIEKDQTNVFVKYLPNEFKDDDLYSLFSSFGKVLSSKVMIDSKGNSYGYGFVRFSNPNESALAIESMDGYQLMNKKLLCRLSNLYSNYNSKFPSNNLFIKPLPPNVSDEQLRQLFLPFGEIVECKVMVDQNGQSKLAGFVRFQNESDATKAIQSMNGVKIGDNNPLVVKYADTEQQKSLRKQRKYSNYYAAQQQQQQNPNYYNYIDPYLATAYIPYPNYHQPYYTQPQIQLYPTAAQPPPIYSVYPTNNFYAIPEISHHSIGLPIQQPSPTNTNTNGSNQTQQQLSPTGQPLNLSSNSIIQPPPQQHIHHIHHHHQPPYPTQPQPSSSLSLSGNSISFPPTTQPLHHHPHHNSIGSPLGMSMGSPTPSKPLSSSGGIPNHQIVNSHTHSNSAPIPIPSSSTSKKSQNKKQQQPQQPQHHQQPQPQQQPQSRSFNTTNTNSNLNSSTTSIPSSSPNPSSSPMSLSSSTSSTPSYSIGSSPRKNVISPVPSSSNNSTTSTSSSSTTLKSSQQIDKHQNNLNNSSDHIKSKSNANNNTSSNNNSDTNLFVFHIPSFVDDKYLYDLFSPFGQLQSVRVITDKETGENKGYGFVKYFNKEDAAKSLKEMNGFQIGLKYLKVKFKDNTSPTIHNSSDDLIINNNSNIDNTNDNDNEIDDATSSSTVVPSSSSSSTTTTTTTTTTSSTQQQSNNNNSNER
eukprot:gene4034-5049_t